MAINDDSAHGLLPRFCHDDSALLEAGCDELQHCLVEARILENESALRVQGRFCSDCQQMLDKWPVLDVQSKDYPHVVRRYVLLGSGYAERLRVLCLRSANTARQRGIGALQEDRVKTRDIEFRHDLVFDNRRVGPRDHTHTQNDIARPDISANMYG